MSDTPETVAAGTRGVETGTWWGRLARAVGGLLAGGKGILSIRSGKSFRRRVLEARGLVLVMFSKTACPTCVALGPVMRKLAREYAGRVVVARYKHYNPFLRLTSKEIMERYRVYLVPTVILFVNGQERRRWFMNYRARDYRKTLDKILASDGDGGEDVAGEPEAGGEPGETLPDCCGEGGACRVLPSAAREGESRK
ncbi:MAG: thioredoxin family protein [Planctomycetota bacterium]|nr:thioredoxin family protein [Planctomycetota bacterium]